MMFVSRILAAALVGLSIVVGLFGAVAQAASVPANVPVAVQGNHFVDAAGHPVFLLGANYEGPPDRAWLMWDDGKFDPDLIAHDLDHARAANVSVLRIFVRLSLATDILNGHWDKLDTMLNLADQHGIRLILTFADYTEWNVSKLVAVDSAVAARYHGRQTIFAYDVKNEPHLGDLALSIYPSGVHVALQDPSLVAKIGQKVARKDIPAYRATDAGKAEVPQRLTDDQAYVYVNVHAAYLRFLDQAQSWSKAHHSNIAAYYLSADSASWNPLKDALNDTFATWLKPQLDALRGPDPNRLVTVGQVDPIIASLPANNWLDYRDLHDYPTASTAGIQASMALFDSVKSALPGKPLVLGEFGFSNATVDPGRSATLASDTVKAVRDHGGAGALKWMLNDFPKGFNARENNFGMYRGDGSAKPVVAAFQALGVLRPTGQAPAARAADYDISGGHFYTQTNGRPSGRDASGFSITDADGVPFWDTFHRLGGVPALGYPVSRRYFLDGFVVQATQKAILQWQPTTHQVALVNVFDRLHDAGLDRWLETVRQTPPPFDTSADTGKPWATVVAQHLKLLDANPAMKKRFLAEPDWLNRFGLPVSTADYPGVYVVRAQRAVLQQWKSNVPWAKAGEITIANGGDVAKEAGLVPAAAMVPEPAG